MTAALAMFLLGMIAGALATAFAIMAIAPERDLLREEGTR